jgi:isocitrate dehydrogenase kinase/phosphatase
MKRFDELVAGIRQRFPDDLFFDNYEDLVIDKQEHYRCYNDAFIILDDESWNILKLKAIQHFPDEREGQLKESFFNHLNEALAYKFLLEASV